MEAGKSVKKPSKSAYRHYCCICSNYRGKIIDDNVITLHRFPAEKKLQTAWIKRIKLVSPSFQLNIKNDRVCSAHFHGGTYVKGRKENNVPSIFLLKDDKRKTFGSSSLSENSEMCLAQEHELMDVDSEQLSEATSSIPVHDQLFTYTVDIANEQVSTLLHDYCGPVPHEQFSTTLDKNVQTLPLTNTTSTSTQTSDHQIDNHPCSVSVSTQTDFESACENCDKDKSVTRSVGTQVAKPDITFEDIRKSDEMCMFYTGIPNAGTFDLLFDEMSDAEQHTHRVGSGENQGRPRVLRLIDEFFLVLMRLRLGLLLQDLAQRFHISKSTCSNITNQWISYLSVKLAFLTAWPSKVTIQQHMPNKFKRKYPNCRVIIDCTEIYTETPQSLTNKSLLYSHYKSHMTYKALLGISPAGLITFSSDLWAGSISDKQLTQNCGILDMCQAGDAIMADKGFLISDLTTPRGIQLIIPPLKYQRFNRKQVEETRRIANLRIDVERAMERVKNFRILQGVMPITLSHQASKIWKLCVCLSNLLPPLVQDED